MPDPAKKSPPRANRGNGKHRKKSAANAPTEPKPVALAFPLIGIGASAGGLEAVTEFLKSVPENPGMAFVFVQHLSPDSEGTVVRILSQRTKLTVCEVEDGMAIEVDHFYVIRPDRTLLVKDGHLRLTEPIAKRGHRRPIDDFFRSLAVELKRRAIAIVLSGMGSNGSAGAGYIKAAGGVCIAQNPENARFPSMPRRLIELGLADLVKEPGEMPAMLLGYWRQAFTQDECHAEPNQSERAILGEILHVLHARTGREFAGYKKPTLFRRVQRRMSLNRLADMGAYLKWLQQTPTEAATLVDDLMIHVTSFFRDPGAWEAMRTKAVDPIVASRPDGSPLRAWVTACSSGEEAYSLAMILVEAADAARKSFDIKIFATDTAERSLTHARAGIYPTGIEGDISQSRLNRFFDRDDAFYRVKAEIREMVVFAPQNLLHDPPFSRLDICTCRNLLIYLEPELQRRALSLMHFGLRANGVLFLGSSETVAVAEGLFKPLDKKHRIYRRVGPTRHGDIQFPTFSHATISAARKLPPGATPAQLSIAQLTVSALLDRHTPAAVVINRDQRIVYYHGDTQAYLAQPQGEPTDDLMSLARENVRGALRSALHLALAENVRAASREGFVITPAGRVPVEVVAEPLHSRSPGYVMVSFREEPDSLPAVPALPPGDGNAQANDELRRMREELQSTIEELQTSNEEMRASNEEVTSVNEELQSTNEEIQTSKEELQSLNEELSTVNAQLQAKMEELEETTNDLSSLLSSTDIAVVFLDLQFRIRRFTPAVKDLIELIPPDIGRPLNDLARKFKDDELAADSTAVLDRLVPVEREIVSDSQRVYVRRILPYRTTDNRIAGIVITFIDITERKRFENALSESETRHRLTLDSLKEYAIFMLDREGRIASWNGGSQRLLGFTSEEALGREIDLALPTEFRSPTSIAERLHEAQTGGSVEISGWTSRKDGTKFWSTGFISALAEPDGKLRGFVRLLRDDTDRKLQAEALEQTKAAAEAANHAKDHFLASVSHELRTPLSSITLWAKLLQENLGKDAAIVDEAVHAIGSSAEELGALINDLFDTARIVSGHLNLDFKDVSLVEIVTSVVDRLRPAAQAKQLTMETNFDPRVGHLRADPLRLQQVVTNLIGNAIKFTPEGGRITVNVETDSGQIVFRVHDTGKGIEPSFLPKLFQPYGQAEAGQASAADGLGLGLSIAAKLIKLHGGTIEAESGGPDRGATFSVFLPLPALAPVEESAPLGEGSVPSHPLQGRRILLVEDSEPNRRALNLALASVGAQITDAGTVAEALAALGREPFDLIVCDLGLPDGDGLELLQQLKAAASERNEAIVPAIALTAFGSTHVGNLALASGFARCLTKPIAPAKLIDELSRFLKDK